MRSSPIRSRADARRRTWGATIPAQHVQTAGLTYEQVMQVRATELDVANASHAVTAIERIGQHIARLAFRALRSFGYRE